MDKVPIICKSKEVLKVDADLRGTQAELDDLDPKKVVDKAEIRAGQRNDTAVAQLTMSFQTAGLFDKVNQVKTTDWPDGLATSIVTRLKQDYQPIDRISRIEMRRKMNEVSMMNDDDPKVIFKQISTIRNHYAGLCIVVEDEDLMTSVMEKALAQYASVLVVEERVRGNALTLTHLEQPMRSQYRIFKERKDKTNHGELLLTGFDGKCYKCNKVGHRANKCPESNTGSSRYDRNNGQDKRGGRFKGKCNNCGKEGHKGADCWQKEENADKRPYFYRKGEGKKGMTSKNNDASSDSEFLLMTKNKGLTFAANDSLLADPNIWIADSSATSDTTAYEIGTTNTKMASDKDNITDASGNNVSGKTVGDLKGVICNEQGKALHDATIKELVYVPGSTFNLFSLNKRLENE